MQRRTRFALAASILLTLALESSANPANPAGYLGSYVLQNPGGNGFGGFSAIEISEDGARFTAISDHGSWLLGTIDRGADGRIAKVATTHTQPLRSEKITPLRRDRSDSEGLAIAQDGTIYISFEGVPRVLRYKTIDGTAENLPTPKEFSKFPINAALESLAIDAQGVLYTMPEEVPGSKRVRILTGQPGNPNGADFPVWRFANGAWTQPFTLTRRGSYLPVGSDFGPDGRFYLLERDFHGIAGFSSRVRSFRVTAKGFTDEKIHLESHAGLHDNLEGISVWRDAKGKIRLTMIADNNFMPFQRSELVEYQLP